MVEILKEILSKTNSNPIDSNDNNNTVDDQLSSLSSTASTFESSLVMEFTTSQPLTNVKTDSIIRSEKQKIEIENNNNIQNIKQISYQPPWIDDVRVVIGIGKFLGVLDLKFII